MHFIFGEKKPACLFLILNYFVLNSYNYYGNMFRWFKEKKTFTNVNKFA